MKDLTQVMRDAAEQAYLEIDSRHGYTGLCAGLSAACRELGFDLPPRYFSTRFHDPLSGFIGEFERGWTFPELVRAWDLMWFGLGTGNFRELPYPWNSLSRTLRSPAPQNYVTRIEGIEQRVIRHLKETKTRRGTKAYKEFVRANARGVLDEAVRLAKISFDSAADECRSALAKTAEMHQKASEEVASLADEASLRRRLLNASSLVGSSATTSEMQRRSQAWQHVADQLAEHAAHLEDLRNDYLSADAVEDAALEALEKSDLLAAFPAAINMYSRYRSAHGDTRKKA